MWKGLTINKVVESAVCDAIVLHLGPCFRDRKSLKEAKKYKNPWEAIVEFQQFKIEKRDDSVTDILSKKESLRECVMRWACG